MPETPTETESAAEMNGPAAAEAESPAAPPTIDEVRAEVDRDRLATALRRFERTRVVVSYYDHPRLAALYPGWALIRIDVAKSLVNSGIRGEKGATKAPEVLLINRPAPSSGPTLF